MERAKILGFASSISGAYDRVFKGANGIVWEMHDGSEKDIEIPEIPIYYICQTSYKEQIPYFDLAFSDQERYQYGRNLDAIHAQFSLAEEAYKSQKHPIGIIVQLYNNHGMTLTHRYAEWIESLLDAYKHCNLVITTAKKHDRLRSKHLKQLPKLNEAHVLDIRSKVDKQYKDRVSSIMDAMKYMKLHLELSQQEPQRKHVQKYIEEHRQTSSLLILDDSCIGKETYLAQLLKELKQVQSAPDILIYTKEGTDAKRFEEVLLKVRNLEKKL